MSSHYRSANWKIEGQLSVYLDLIRWLAAVIVVVSHIKGLFFADYSDVAHPNIGLKVLYAVASAGHQSVMVFFVLSGLFISANVMKSIEKGTWSWKTYLTGRLTRLYIVLIPALLLGLMWDQFGILVYGGTGVYDGLPEDKYILGYSTVSHSTWEAFLGNLFYLQGIGVGHFGSNGPLWSLAYEFWYYILFPCLMLALFAKTGFKRIAYLAASAVLCLFIGKQMLLYFIVWALGFAIHGLPAASVKFPRAWLGLFSVLTLSGIVFYRALPVSAFLADLLIAGLFAVLVYLMKGFMNGKRAAPAGVRWSKFLAGFSYSTYLVHFPFLVFVHAMVYARSPVKWQPDGASLAMGMVLLIITLAYCWLISSVTESRTESVRLRITLLLGRRKAAKPAYENTVRL